MTQAAGQRVVPFIEMVKTGGLEDQVCGNQEFSFAWAQYIYLSCKYIMNILFFLANKLRVSLLTDSLSVFLMQ